MVILKKNNINHQNHSNNAKKQKNFQMTKHLHRDLSTTNQKNRPFGLQARHLQGLHVIVRLLGTEEGVLYWKLLLRIVI